jgi:hypothetical protein
MFGSLLHRDAETTLLATCLFLSSENHRAKSSKLSRIKWRLTVCCNADRDPKADFSQPAYELDFRTLFKLQHRAEWTKTHAQIRVKRNINKTATLNLSTPVSTARRHTKFRPHITACAILTLLFSDCEGGIPGTLWPHQVHNYHSAHGSQDPFRNNHRSDNLKML